jgi:predicted nuclease of restriction endonuclease-like (RecB) superfamily
MDNNLEYKDTLHSIIATIKVAQLKTVMAANSQMLLAYWQIGSQLSAKIKAQAWGAKIIDNFSADIRKALPNIKGFSVRNLVYMRQFADAYPPQTIIALNQIAQQITQPMVALIEQAKNIDTQITQPVVAQMSENYFLDSIIGKISWSHHLVLLDKCPPLHQRFWYMLNTLNHGISKNILLMQVEANLYQRQMEQKKISNFSTTLPQPQSDFAQYLLKDPYIFDFVQAKENADERNIEAQLTQHITKFLLELGQGFAFVGKQYHLKVGGSDFYTDLLFYHTKLHCYVVVELKARAFEPGDPAQLNFYINVINDQLKTENDNETIGILLCKGKNEVVAEYALKGYSRPIGVADYELSKAIPADLKSTLPSIEEIENELKGMEEDGE